MTSEAAIVANLFGPFYSRTRTKSVKYIISKDTPTIRDLVEKIIQQFPNIEEFIFDGTELAENTMIVKNGDIIGGDHWLDEKISPNDRISFFQGQHGG
jgi:molybdopterin converting factor small subunit